ncbi:hypothetical protein SO694_00011461 [Aureococcus anophagefferens]|uniref:Glycosyltransferase family 92 protein n=1 Tax=Aureococcus anophagefferens TaxID=44056 RepID=A0ABR1GES1_AURAN
MAPDALPSSLERGLRKVGLGQGRYEVWKCAFSPRMAVRERPEAKAQIVATLQKDQHFIADVKKAKGGTWLVFGAPELWGCRCNNRKAYVCIEGDSVGHPNLGTLVERVGGDEDLALLKSHWAYTESILRVEEAGVDWHVEPCPEDSLRWFGPYRNRPLAPTHDEDGVPLAPTIPWLRRWSASGDAPDGSTPTIDALCLEAARDGPGRGRNARVEADGAYRRSGVAQYRIDEGRQQRHFRDRPRLCIAMLVRGAPASTLDSFCRYHFGIGFERIFFFFDAPDDPREADAIAVAERWTRKVAVPGSSHRLRFAVVHRCDAAWWRDEERSGRNRLFVHGRDYKTAEDAPPMGGPFGLVRTAPNPLQKAARDAVKWHEEVRDVQARQQLVIERACNDAAELHFDWILHVDADELLYFPEQKYRTDAPAFFADAPDAADEG